MSSTTPNLGLFKYDPITDGKETFSITTALNNNWDIIDKKCRGGLEVCDIGMALYIDETKGLRRYLNGQIVDINTNTQAFLNRLKEIQTTNPDYFTTEDNWQTEATLNIDGCVYKFVLNYADDGETVVSVRLPKYPEYVEVNAGGTLPVVGNGMALGLTNGTDYYSPYNQIGNAYMLTSANGFGKIVGIESSFQNLAGTGVTGVTSDHTKSGIETTLKQTKLKMRYFIQIATGSETENNIINEIELNNPCSLFDSKYSDHELNNLSWLKSEGQWNAKAVYPTAYDKLLKVYNGTETVEGLSVKLSTETYTDYDFVLNTAEETFRLPLLDGSESLPGSVNELIGSSTISYTLQKNGTVKVRGVSASNSRALVLAYSVSASNGDHAYSAGTAIMAKVQGKKGDLVRVDVENCTDVSVYFTPAKGNGSLYYYVGETIQNANLIDAGRIGEQLANKQDKCVHIIDTYVNGTSGYRIWSNGYCEQWGVSNGAGSRTITLTKAYANTNYNLVGSSDSLNTTYDSSSKIVTASTFTIYTQLANNYYWRTIGIIS